MHVQPIALISAFSLGANKPPPVWAVCLSKMLQKRLLSWPLKLKIGTWTSAWNEIPSSRLT